MLAAVRSLPSFPLFPIPSIQRLRPEYALTHFKGVQRRIQAVRRVILGVRGETGQVQPHFLHFAETSQGYGLRKAQPSKSRMGPQRGNFSQPGFGIGPNQSGRRVFPGGRERQQAQPGIIMQRGTLPSIPGLIQGRIPNPVFQGPPRPRIALLCHRTEAESRGQGRLRIAAIQIVDSQLFNNPLGLVSPLAENALTPDIPIKSQNRDLPFFVSPVFLRPAQQAIQQSRVVFQCLRVDQPLSPDEGARQLPVFILSEPDPLR